LKPFGLNNVIYISTKDGRSLRAWARSSLTKLHKIPHAAVVSFFAGLWEEAAGDFSCIAMIAHALAAEASFGTTVCAGAGFEICFF
jgi:hypothetical protein